MTLPITGTTALALAVVFGFIFGFLLQKGRVTVYDVIVNQFRFRDFTVLKIMLTAIVVGGVGVLLLKMGGYAKYRPKGADLLAVGLGSAIFGVGMVVYGYCPGTGLAAAATGSLHAVVGLIGMLAGGMLYAASYAWLKTNVLNVWSKGKIRLPDVTGVPDAAWLAGLAVAALLVFALIERYGPRRAA